MKYLIMTIMVLAAFVIFMVDAIPEDSSNVETKTIDGVAKVESGSWVVSAITKGGQN